MDTYQRPEWNDEGQQMDAQSQGNQSGDKLETRMETESASQNVDRKQKSINKWLYLGIPILLAGLLFWKRNNFDLTTLISFGALLVISYVVALHDFYYHEISNLFVLLLLGVYLLLLVPQFFLNPEVVLQRLLQGLGGLAISFVVLILVYLISRKGLGGGDVKFMSVVGLYLGVSGVLTALLLASVLSAVVALVLIILKRIGKRDAIPFAPFLFLGIVTAVFLL